MKLLSLVSVYSKEDLKQLTRKNAIRILILMVIQFYYQKPPNALLKTRLRVAMINNELISD